MKPLARMMKKADELKDAGVEKDEGKRELHRYSATVYRRSCAKHKGYCLAVYRFCGEHVGL